MIAAIDIGTNTVLLLIAEEANGKLDILREEQRMPRLGKDVDTDKTLASESIDRVLNVLKEYKKIIENDFSEVSEVIVTATSAVRDAANKDEFLAKVKEKTKFDVLLLSGDSEARFTYNGAINVFDEQVEGDIFVLDIGGGSTEIALGRDGKLIDAHSFDMGCVRFTERYLKQDPPFQEQIQECREAVRNMLSSKIFKPKRNAKSVGVAGTLNSLAAIDLQIDDYNPERMNGHLIVREKLKKAIEVFSLHTHKQLLELSPKVLQGREDIFLAGLLILEEFLKYFELDEIVVSTGGIRHGAILTKLEMA